MRKTTLIQWVLIGAVFLLLFIVFLPFFEGNNNKDKTLLSVNGVSLKEEEIDIFVQQVARDNLDEDLTLEETREKALEKAIRRILLNRYFKKRGIDVSTKEIEDMFSYFILQTPGAETKEDFFEIMGMRGFSRSEIKEEVVIKAKERKLIDRFLKDITVLEGDIEKRYREIKEKGKEIEGVDTLSYEKIKKEIKDDIAQERAKEKIIKELEEKRKSAEIIFFQ